MINTLRLKTLEPQVLNDLYESVGEKGTEETRENDIIDMSFFDAFDAYLKYNGIINYTQDIIDAYEALKKCEVVK